MAMDDLPEDGTIFVKRPGGEIMGRIIGRGAL
jgi:hypothetical protein